MPVPTGRADADDRGYDRDEVNVYISRVEKARKEAEEEATRRREENSGLTTRLGDAEEKLRELGEPTYAGLGRRVEELLWKLYYGIAA